jgi:uncharacterized membrane protein YedE/YeeE
MAGMFMRNSRGMIVFPVSMLAGFMIRFRVRFTVLMGVSIASLLAFGRKDVDFGCGQGATAYFARLKAGINMQRRSGFFKAGEWYARINERTEQHVAADAGEAL